MRGACTSGSSEIKYKIEPYQRKDSHLVITEERVGVFKETTSGIQALDANIKSAVISLFDWDVEYDTRAMAYATGRRLVLLSLGEGRPG